jgi:hypothetical protein
MRRQFFTRHATNTERVRALRARRRNAKVCVDYGLVAPASHADRCHACLGDARDAWQRRKHRRQA